VTFHSRYPVREAVVAEGPVDPGWLFQVTPFSVQVAVSRLAWRVRPAAAAPAWTRSVAESSTHPSGTAGIGNPTRARRFPPDLERALSISAVPLLVEGLLWSIHESASAETVVSVQAGAGSSTVQPWAAGVGSVFPLESVARTSKVWMPTLSPVSSAGEVQVSYGAPSTEHW
jgi:hypothetical protein